MVSCKLADESQLKQLENRWLDLTPKEHRQQASSRHLYPRKLEHIQIHLASPSICSHSSSHPQKLHGNHTGLYHTMTVTFPSRKNLNSGINY